MFFSKLSEAIWIHLSAGGWEGAAYEEQLPDLLSTSGTSDLLELHIPVLLAVSLAWANISFFLPAKRDYFTHLRWFFVISLPTA
jgi:hypothetical protein